MKIHRRKQAPKPSGQPLYRVLLNPPAPAPPGIMDRLSQVATAADGLMLLARAVDEKLLLVLAPAPPTNPAKLTATESGSCELADRMLAVSQALKNAETTLTSVLDRIRL